MLVVVLGGNSEAGKQRGAVRFFEGVIQKGGDEVPEFKAVDRRRTTVLLVEHQGIDDMPLLPALVRQRRRLSQDLAHVRDANALAGELWVG